MKFAFPPQLIFWITSAFVFILVIPLSQGGEKEVIPLTLLFLATCIALLIVVPRNKKGAMPCRSAENDSDDTC